MLKVESREMLFFFNITLHQALLPSKLRRCYDKAKDVFGQVFEILYLIFLWELYVFVHLIFLLLAFINLSSFVSLFFPRDHENKTHILKVKSGGSNGRLPHPEKKKHKKSGH